jgi:hypothetical protein
MISNPSDTTTTSDDEKTPLADEQPPWEPNFGPKPE